MRVTVTRTFHVTTRPAHDGVLPVTDGLVSHLDDVMESLATTPTATRSRSSSVRRRRVPGRGQRAAAGRRPPPDPWGSLHDLAHIATQGSALLDERQAHGNELVVRADVDRRLTGRREVLA